MMTDFCLTVALTKLAGATNVSFHQTSLEAMPLADGSMDFGYSLGCSTICRTRAPASPPVSKSSSRARRFVYVYYAFDNRPACFRLLCLTRDYLRRSVAKAPFRQKSMIAELFAAVVYWPLARSAKLFGNLGVDVANWPLSTYQRRSYYGMRTDALDRFGTRLEHRMTRPQIRTISAVGRKV
jgi:hypothetical protein